MNKNIIIALMLAVILNNISIACEKHNTLNTVIEEDENDLHTDERSEEESSEARDT